MHTRWGGRLALAGVSRRRISDHAAERLDNSDLLIDDSPDTAPDLILALRAPQGVLDDGVIASLRPVDHNEAIEAMKYMQLGIGRLLPAVLPHQLRTDHVVIERKLFKERLVEPHPAIWQSWGLKQNAPAAQV